MAGTTNYRWSANKHIVELVICAAGSGIVIVGTFILFPLNCAASTPLWMTVPFRPAAWELRALPLAMVADSWMDKLFEALLEDSTVVLVGVGVGVGVTCATDTQTQENTMSAWRTAMVVYLADRVSSVTARLPTKGRRHYILYTNMGAMPCCLANQSSPVVVQHGRCAVCVNSF